MKLTRICIGLLVVGLLVLAGFLGKKQLARSYDHLGTVKLGQGDLDGAIKDYNHAIDLDPKYEPAWNNRGFAKKEKDDFPGALADFNRAIELKPDFIRACYNRGLLKQTMGDLDGSIADFSRVLELKPQEVAACTDRASAKDEKGDFEGALADYNHALSIDPNNSSAFIGRSYIKEEQGDLDGAIADASHAVELDSEDSYAFLCRGTVNFVARHWKESLADFREAGDFSMGPADDYPHLYTWVIRVRLGEADDANKELAAHLASRLQGNSKARPDDWPSSLGAFLLGKITEEKLLAAAAVPGDARKDGGQHCEAWFFAGMKKLFAGDKEAAAGCFHKCRATRRSNFLEYQMAGSELKALGE